MGIDQVTLLAFNRILRGIRRRFRNAYYSRVLRSMGKGCQVCDGVLVTGHENVSFGENVVVNDGAIIQSCEGARITIGDNVVISYGVKLITGGLEIGTEGVKRDLHQAAPISIENGVWIGVGAIILPGVTLGDRAIVAAGSVVSRSVDARTIVGGAPAIVIRVMDAADS